jgi:magnesium transporter
MTSGRLAALADWANLPKRERTPIFRGLPQREANELFLGLSTHDQYELLLEVPEEERRAWLRLLPPDDPTDLLQAAGHARDVLASGLEDTTRLQITALLAYKEDLAGGLMSPRFARARPEMTTDEAIAYVRIQSDDVETIYYVYVLDPGQRLPGLLSLRDYRGGSVTHPNLVVVTSCVFQRCRSLIPI